MDGARFLVLKEKLQAAHEFRDVVNYFLDEVATQPGFLDWGHPVQHPFLESIITQVAQQCLPPPVQIMGLILTRLPEQAFIHGGCIVNGHPGTMLYFEDLQMGLFTLAITGTATKFARFTAKSYPQGITPSMN